MESPGARWVTPGGEDRNDELGRADPIQMSHRESEEPPLTEAEIGAEVLQCLRRLTRAIDRHSSALARRYGLTGPQLAVLQALAQLGEVSTSELARRVSLSQPTVSGIVHRMASRGLVTRRPSEWDRRVVLLSPTAEGHRLLSQSPPLLRQPFLDRLAELEPWEQMQLLHALRQIVAMIEQPPSTLFRTPPFSSPRETELATALDSEANPFGTDPGWRPASPQDDLEPRE